ncbi:MAG: phosphatidate cytidylyltransferase [Hyphomicrobiales bacterium]|nr:phosphatidate cytidylyltransferase [Hyphomicrobiales bacterium]
MRSAPRFGSRIGLDLRPRLASAAAMAFVALLAAWFGGGVFVAFWFFAAAVMLWEWQRLVEPERLIERVAAGALALLLAASFALHGSAVGAFAALIPGAVAVGWLAGGAASVWAGGGVLYAGALVVSLALLRASPGYGLAAVLWLFAVTWSADIAAFVAGRLIGGPRLWPSISPVKTWSGGLAGALAGAAAGLLLGGWSNRMDRLFWLGLAAALVSELGDLFESGLKRHFGVKDSSGLIPGHGGLMDRLDAFVAASTFAAVVAAINSRGPYIASGLFQW